MHAGKNFSYDKMKVCCQQAGTRTLETRKKHSD